MIQIISDFLEQMSFPFTHEYEFELSKNRIIARYLMPINTDSKREKAKAVIDAVYDLINKLEQ